MRSQLTQCTASFAWQHERKHFEPAGFAKHCSLEAMKSYQGVSSHMSTFCVPVIKFGIMLDCPTQRESNAASVFNRQ